MAEVTNENDDDVQRDYANEARYIREHTPPMKRGGHELDEEGVCIYCSFDGAEHWHWRNNTYEGRYAARAARETK